jgi:hypothetical protein
MIRPVRLFPHNAPGRPPAGKRSFSDFAAWSESLRRTGQSECELPHILSPSAALLLMKRSLPGPSMPRTSSQVPSLRTPGSRIEFPTEPRYCWRRLRLSSLRRFPTPDRHRQTFRSGHGERRPQPGNPGAVNGTPAHSTGRSVQPNGASSTRLSPRNERGEEIRAQTGGGTCMVQS